jgi:hypothetical protein
LGSPPVPQGVGKDAGMKIRELSARQVATVISYRHRLYNMVRSCSALPGVALSDWRRLRSEIYGACFCADVS